MDIRAQRTVAAMHRAILALAEQEDVQDLPVAKVAGEAGINRVTFYNHAANPCELLLAALRPELDQIRAQFLAEAAARPQGPGGMIVDRAVAEHLVARRMVYRRNLPANGHGFLADFLSDHFAESVRIFLAARHGSMPGGPDDSSRPKALMDAVTAQFLAHGATGAIAVWLHTPDPLEPGQLSGLLKDLMPHWWTQEVPDSLPEIHQRKYPASRPAVQAGQP